jgi:hypothetical protein
MRRADKGLDRAMPAEEAQRMSREDANATGFVAQELGKLGGRPNGRGCGRVQRSPRA